MAVAWSARAYFSVRHFSVGAFPVRQARQDTDRKMWDRNIKSPKSRRPRLPSLTERPYDETVTGSARLRVSSETTTSTMKPSGIVTMPGWLNGTKASALFQPKTFT